jgi:DNA-binding NarL/FixJ family response regulator
MQTVFEDEEKIFAAIHAGARGYFSKKNLVNTNRLYFEEKNNEYLCICYACRRLVY